MKRKRIENIIRRDITSSTPDVRSRINLDDITIKRPHKTPWLHALTRPRFRVAMAGAAMVLLALAVIFITVDEPTPTPRQVAFESKEEVYSVSAFSAVLLLHQAPEDSNDSVRFNGPLTLSATLMLEANGRLIDDHMETLNRYLNVFEPLLDDKGRMQFTHQASDRDGYAYMTVFQGVDMRHQAVEYILYYNETIEGDSITLDGLMLVGDITYVLEGEIDVDDEEFDLELYAYKQGDRDTYIKVTQTIEANEQTFEYEHVVDGDTVFESSLTIEHDNNTITIELEYATHTDEVEFTMERRTDTLRDTIFIEYEIETPTREEEGTIEVEIVFDDVAETYTYRYHITVDDEAYSIDKERVIDARVGDLFRSHASIIDPFIERFDQMQIGDEFFAEMPSPHPDFEVMLTLFVGDYDTALTHATITLHYNKTVDDDTTIVHGMLIINGIEHALDGEFDHDEDEHEGELFTDDEAFIFAFSVDEDGQEYIYSLEVQGTIVWEFSVFIDWDDLIMELEYTLGDEEVDITLVQTNGGMYDGEFDIDTDHADESGSFTYTLNTETNMATYVLSIGDARRTIKIERDAE